MEKQEVRILCPTGHLGFIPIHKTSFRLGMEMKPDYYCCDSGSRTIGPGHLGSDTGMSLYDWQKHDLELMLLASRQQGVPLIIGSAGDTGTNSKVDQYVRMIEYLARKHTLAPFKLVYFYSEVSKDLLKNKLEQGAIIESLEGTMRLTNEEFDQTERIVAVAGANPFLEALQRGADVTIGGRSSAMALFAAAALYEGCAEHLAYAMGRMLAEASRYTEPGSLQKTLIGTIAGQEVSVRAVPPHQRCTMASMIGNLRSDGGTPVYESVMGGVLDMTDCHYEQEDDATIRLTGATFIPVEGHTHVTLEGAGKVGDRVVGIIGVRDSYTMHHLDTMLAWTRSQIEQQFVGKSYELVYRVYGKPDALNALTPIVADTSPEVGILLEGIAETEQLAEELTVMAMRHLLYAPPPNGTAPAGFPDLVLDGLLSAPPAYRWTINHTIEVDDPVALFEMHEMMIGV